MNIGKRLRLRRIALDMTLEDVAQAIGVSANYISLIERGKNVPSDEIIDKLAELYGMDRDELYECYGKIPATIQEELEEYDVLKEAIKAIGRDERLTPEDKEHLYERLLYWHKKLKEDKE
jgi:transcriptional regulator with XRE-family HTH domain